LRRIPILRKTRKIDILDAAWSAILQKFDTIYIAINRDW